MKCLNYLLLDNSNIREWPLSLGYLTKGVINLELSNCENLGKGNFLDSTNKLQPLEEIDTATVNSSDSVSGSGSLSLTDSHLDCFGGNIIDLDLWMKNDYFPALRYMRIDNSNIVSIPECISRLSKLKRIYLINCKELREIPRLPQSIRHVEIIKCPSLLPQSSSRLLNQFGKILGILPNNRVREGAKSDILINLFDEPESESDSEIECGFLLLPGTEIPKSFKFNHQSFGNSISFRVGRIFPKLAVCVAIRSAEHKCRQAYVNVSINGCKQKFHYLLRVESCEELWLFSKSLGQLNNLNLSEQNQVEVEVICKKTRDRNHTDFIKWFGVNVECICCPQKSDITYLPLPSDRNGCGSSSVLNDTELPPFQPAFPTSYGSVMDCGAFNDEGDLGNSMEPPNTGFEPGLKGFLGDLNVSLSAPNNSELLALLPGPKIKHEVSNAVHDLKLLKGIHNDGCDLSLSLNDSDERESEPSLFPDSTNGFDFSFAQPNLELGSSVSGGFHLGSSLMAHACVNDDSDFNMGPPPKKMSTS